MGAVLSSPEEALVLSSNEFANNAAPTPMKAPKITCDCVNSCQFIEFAEENVKGASDISQLYIKICDMRKDKVFGSRASDLRAKLRKMDEMLPVLRANIQTSSELLPTIALIADRWRNESIQLIGEYAKKLLDYE